MHLYRHTLLWLRPQFLDRPLRPLLLNNRMEHIWRANTHTLLGIFILIIIGIRFMLALYLHPQHQARHRRLLRLDTQPLINPSTLVQLPVPAHPPSATHTMLAIIRIHPNIPM